jgi:AP-1 complex subunit mu
MSKRNTNAVEIILFLHRLCSVRNSYIQAFRSFRTAYCLALSPAHSQVLTEYFKELEEESIRDNFVIIYELLDEMMDFGYPQTTESKILQE